MEEQADYNVNDYIPLTNTWQEDPTAYLNRYYTLFYKASNDPARSSVYVRQTPSKVCVLGINDDSLIASIKKVRMYTNLVGNKVKADTILCDLLDQDDQIVSQVRAEMEGKLLELNKRFTNESCESLLGKGHHMDIGFIAIILPKTENTEIQLRDFQTAEEFKK